MKTPPSEPGSRSIDAFGERIAARLDDAHGQLPHDISERLRAARVQAVERRKQLLLQDAEAVHARGGTLSAAGGSSFGWLQRIEVLGMLLVLLVGLYTINVIQDERGARELADVDAALLTDELPPAAYTDAGFAQFLKIGSPHER